MPDWDAIIVGGGPAGLTAGLYLSRGNWRTLLLEKENVGGYIVNVEMIENYPGFADGVPGAELAMAMKDQATKYGLQLQRSEVTRVRDSGDTKWVTCADGNVLRTKTVILTGGAIPKKLGVPGEDRLRGSGVIACAFCDGGEFAGRVVAVCGGGDAGITEALYLTRLASRVVLIEALSGLTATAVLQKRAEEAPNLEIRCGERVTAIIGQDHVEAISLLGHGAGQPEILAVDGVLVHVGLDPNTGFLEGVVPLDGERRVIVNDRLETGIPGVFAAGDIRAGSPRQVATAVGDGSIAAVAALRFLQKDREKPRF